MHLPYKEHPIIKEYNEIKRYFRKHETKIAKTIIKDFYHFAKIINKLDYEIAFDFVGSLNFGILDIQSDVDLIIYIGCKKHITENCDEVFCPQLQEIQFLLKEKLIKNTLNESYPIQLVDIINLKKLEWELTKENPDLDIIFRFTFYRSICRGVNLRVLKPYYRKLLRRSDIIQRIESYIDDVFKKFNENSKHQLSFEKYRIRLDEIGIKIPYSIIKKIKNHIYIT